MTTHPRLLTTKEAAQMLAVHHSTITRWADEGKLEKVVLPSGRYRFKLESVEKILAGDPA